MVALQLALAAAMRQTEWVDFQSSHLPLEIVPIAVTGWLWLLLRPFPKKKNLGLQVRPTLVLIGGTLLGAGLLLQQLTNVIGRWAQWRPETYQNLKQLLQELQFFIVQEGFSSVTSFNSRLTFWIEGVRGSGAQQDDLILIGFGGIILFLLAFQSTLMFLVGKPVMLSLLPSLAMFAYILYFSQGSRLLLLGYLALLFSLFAWNQQQKLVETWQRAKVDYPDGIEFDRAVGVGGALLIMSLTAGVIPSVDVAKVTDWVQETLRPMDEATSDFGERMFPDLQSQVGGQNKGTAGGLPNSFLLGNSPELSNQVALKVLANYPFTEERGFYMRGRVYEKYDGKGWSNAGPGFADPVNANDSLEPPPYPYRREVWQAVEFYGDSQIAYAIAEPIQFSVRVRPETNELGIPLFFRNVDRRSYSVLSSMPLLNEEVLREVTWEAYDEVPNDVLEIYLDLPDTVSDRTLSLARELAQDTNSPYEFGLAVETFLREIPYDLQVRLPGPEVRDVADFFLFELGRGFCDYYTTAFVVLMRSSGVPVRFAAGFAPGYLNQYSEEWIITDAQAHSWPEVWFPRLGWIPFEPTAGRQVLDRSYLPIDFAASDDSLGQDIDPLLLDFGTSSDLPWKAILGWGAIILVLISLLFFLPRWRVSQTDPWISLLAWGRRLGQAKLDWETESEYASRFSDMLGTMPRVQDHDARAINSQINQIVRITIGVKYGRGQGSAKTLNKADQQWSYLRSRLRRLHFLRV